VRRSSLARATARRRDSLPRVDDEALRTRLRDGLAHEQRVLGTHAPDGQVIEREGVVGSIIGSVPDASLPNAVVAVEPGLLTPALIEELRAAYAAAGVRKWGVWVHPEDADALGALAAAGLVFDSHPVEMGAVLADLDLDGAPPARSASGRDAGRVNDLAYGITDGRFEQLLGVVPEDLVHTFGAYDDDGEPVSVVTVLEHGGDAAVWMVATVPWARNQGHAKRLMRRALLEAHERGCETTTLLASALGAPVYTALGYRTLGELHLWERRS
jgi:GNAT superfamily N-acetyltransferase